MFNGETNMSPTLIPLENWLGYFKENGNSKTDRKFVSTECFKVLDLGVLKDFNGFESHQALANLFGTELVLGINNILNTDISLWPEGVNEDFSNVAYYLDEESGQYKFQIIINGDNIEGGFETTIINKEGVEEVVNQFAFTVIPKFNTFIDNEKDVFMNLITTGEFSDNLNSNLAIVAKVRETAPQFRLMKIDLNTMPDMYKYDTVSEVSPLMKVGICRYINKCFPNVIHEDMVSKLKHFSLMEKPDDQLLMFGVSFDIFGYLYFISVEYFKNYDFNPVDETTMEDGEQF